MPGKSRQGVGGGGPVRVVAYGHARVAVNIADDRRYDRRAEAEPVIARLFVGHPVTDTALGDLAGAPEDGRVTVRVRPGYPDQLRLSFTTPNARVAAAERNVYRDPDGKLVLYNQTYRLEPWAQGEGEGLKMLATQVKAAQRLGVNRIETEATKATEFEPDGTAIKYFGHGAWAEAGYKGAFPGPPSERRRLADKLLRYAPPQAPRELVDGINSHRVENVVRAPDGLRLWRAYGRSYHGEFDVHDAESLAMLRAALARRGISYDALA